MIPIFDKFIHPVLELQKDGKLRSLKEIREAIQIYFHLTDKDLEEKVKSGTQPKFNNRVQWATTYLKKAGLLDKPQTGYCKITEEGLKVLSEGVIVNNQYLKEHSKAFQEFSKGNSNGNQSLLANSDEHFEEEIMQNAETPNEIILKNFQIVNQELADELLQAIKNQSARFFEQLVIDLLVKMGYGGEFENNAIVTQYTNDEGIDGVIKEDKLGLDKIYVQAKKYSETNVGREEIQKFVGALAGQGATKGVFITTSKFTTGARNYKALGAKIVLIDGLELCHYMIEYNLGVSVKETYEIKKIDTDFFN